METATSTTPPEQTTPTIRFNLPTSRSPGYLRRQRDWARIQARMASKDPQIAADALDDMIRFLAGYVIGVEPDQAFDLLLDLSEEELRAAGAVLSGENPTR